MTAERKPESQSIDLREILRVLMRRKGVLLLPWSVALLAGIAAAFLLRPIYFSHVTLLFEQPQNISSPLGGVVGGVNSEHRVDIMREQAQSSLFLRSVITGSGIVSEKATRQWALRGARQYPNLPPEEQAEAFLVDYLRDAVTIKRARGNIFQITVQDYRADRARLLAEAVASQFVISAKAAQLEAVRETQEFSLEQQRIYKRKLEESEQREEEFKRVHLSSDVSGSAVSEANVPRARALLDQAGLAEEEQRQRVAEIRAQFGPRVRDNDPDLLTSPETRALSAQLNGLERQLATALVVGEGAGDDDAVARQAIARKLAELEVRFIRNAASALPGLAPESRDLLVRYRLAQADLEAKQGRRIYLAGQVGSYEQRVVQAPDRDLELQRLTQEVENNRAFYNAFLKQSVAAQIAEAFENAKVSGRFVVIEPANLPRSPGKPNRPVLILLALVVGGVIGVGLVLLVEQHDLSVKNVEEVESLLGLPVLGAVPRVPALERSRRRRRSASGSIPGTVPGNFGLLHRLQVESPLGLEFRRVCLKLAKAHSRSLPGTVLVTSSTRGEGKTTAAACLAITLARELDRKLLLVDFDLRSPSLHRALGLPSSSWGLSQMLQQHNFDERFVRSTVLPRLEFLPAGRSERPPAELMDTETVEWFVRQAGSRYAHIVIDSAPTLAVPDPLILGRMVEGVVYVIKAGSTVRRAAEYGVKVQREACDNLLGVLLNDSGEILPQYYGYHDAYGYTPDVAEGEA